MFIVGWSDLVGEVLWGGVFIFYIKVIIGNVSDRIYLYFKKRRNNFNCKD